MSGPATTGAIETFASHTTTVGSLPIRRALPQRSRRTVGAWCFLDHAGPVEAQAAGDGIGPHPHIGLQTVTWVIEGELLHRDSLGNEQPIRRRQLNLMTAGHGVVHAEEQLSTGMTHLVQLWVAQPEATRNGAPAFDHHPELPQLDLARGTATVLVGTLGTATSPARRDTDHFGAEIEVDGRVVVPIDRAHEHTVIPIEGVVDVAGQSIAADNGVYLGPGRDELELRTHERARVMLLGGVPFGESISMWWNYVARTHEEISQAHDDWTSRRDRFPVPASKLAPVDVGPPPWSAP